MIFFPEYRTRHIQEFTTSSQQPPQGIDQHLLARGKLRDIRLAPRPFDIGMAARYTRSRTRHVSHYPVKGYAIPPCRCSGRIAAHHVRSQPQTPQIGMDTFQPRRVLIKRGERHIRQFQYMRGFTAGRRAGIEHPHAILRIEQGRGALRGCVLHRDVAFAETRQPL